MNLQKRMISVVEGLPPEGYLTLPVATLLEWVHEDMALMGKSTPQFKPDLTVRKVAQLLDLSENTITRYIRERKLRAYKRGKEYRISTEALTDYQVVQQSRG